LGRFGGPSAPARFGGRQGTLGPAPVHFGRDQRPEAAAWGAGEGVLLGGSPAKKQNERGFLGGLQSRTSQVIQDRAPASTPKMSEKSAA